MMRSTVALAAATLLAPLMSAQVSDAPIATYRTDLLDIALSAASKYPLDPHIKNRSRAQEQVVTTALLLDQPSLALEAIESIANWRRGAGYAEYAEYCVRKGDLSAVDDLLARAEKVARTSPDAIDQSWRAERIGVKIAEVHVLLDDAERAARYEVGIGEAETGKVALTKAERVSRDDVDAQLDQLQSILATESFDLVRNAMPVYAALYERFYSDADVRERIEKAVMEGWDPIPANLRVEMLEDLADAALAHEDTAKADEFIALSVELVDHMQVNPEFGVPILARLSALRFRAGHADEGRAGLEKALALFDADRELISKTFRPDTLIPVAQAYASIGELASARHVYDKALVAALVSLNSRPRTDDLVSICCSMALNDVRPDSAFMARLKSVHDSLGHPW